MEVTWQLSSSYQIWLIQGNDSIQLPFNPEEIGITSGSKNSRINVNQLGDITIFQPVGLTGISFDSHFPITYFEGCQYTNIPSPLDAIEMIQNMRDNEEAIRLVITDTDVDIDVSIDQFNTFIRGGDIGSIYYDISLLEYREPTVNIVTVVDNEINTSQAESTRPDTFSRPKTYTVKSGDSLWKIAKSILNDGSKWSSIFEANKTLISNANLIYVGQVLIIPQEA